MVSSSGSLLCWSLFPLLQHLWVTLAWATGLVFLLLGEGSVPEHTVQFWSRCNGSPRAILCCCWHFKVPDQPSLVLPSQVDRGACKRVLSRSAQHQPNLAGGEGMVALPTYQVNPYRVHTATSSPALAGKCLQPLLYLATPLLLCSALACGL